MAKIDSTLASGAYSTFTSALEMANTADAIKNDIIKFKNEVHNREVETSHKEMQDTSKNTKELQF